MHLLVSEDGAVAALCQAALSTTSGDSPEALAGFRLGMAHTAAWLWREDELRPAATPFWTGLAAVADAEAAEALMDVFGRGGPLPRDGHTRSLLLATTEFPAVLGVTDSMTLVDRLKELLRDGTDPRLIASVATAVATGGRPAGRCQHPLGGVGRGLGGGRAHPPAPAGDQGGRDGAVREIDGGRDPRGGGRPALPRPARAPLRPNLPDALACG